MAAKASTTEARTRHRRTGRTGAALLALAGAAVAPAAAAGQTGPAHADSAGIVPGPEYSAGGLHAALFGSRYRELWQTPITVPVLDLDAFAGGLTPEDRGGTSQSIVLHMVGADGREWHFRSVNKDVSQGLPDDLVGTPVGNAVQDQVSALHPGAAFVVAPLMEAAGLLHADPRPVLMPDHPRLGPFREEFAGMLGMIEEKPDEGENDEVLFGGSEKIVAMDKMLERLEESGDHLVVAEEFLTARLIDMLVGDTDRGMDQWRWARYGPEGEHVWRPIARDRDWAFVLSDGLLLAPVRATYPKVGAYGPEYGGFSQYVFMSAPLDRQLLATLDRAAFDSVASALQSALTDGVIDDAVASMPAPFVSLDGAWLAGALRSRRDSLPGVARRFYEFLADEVDIEVSDDGEEAVIDRHADGSLTVTVRRVGPGEDSVRTVVERETYRRRFLPGETREIRLDLHGGDDRAVVRGGGSGEIRVRVMGGGDNDVLADSSETDAGRRATHLYDSNGDDEFLAEGGTRVDRRDFDPPEPTGAWPATKISGYFKDWGSSSGISPTGRYRSGAGTIVGAARRWTKYGFRRVPYQRRFEIAALIATRDWRPGVEASARFRRENSPFGFAVGGRAIAYHTVRFYGPGNDTPEPPDHDTRLVRQEEYRAAAHLEARLPAGLSFAAGPFVRYTDVVEFDSAAPFGALGVEDGARSFGTAGFEADAAFSWRTGGPAAAPDAGGPEGPDDPEAAEVDIEELADDPDHDPHDPEAIEEEPDPSIRVEASLGGSWVPELWDAASAFGESHAIARAHLRAPGDLGLELGMRLGGQRVWGGFPFHESAFVGGLRSLRGFNAFRYAGDASAYGGLELGVPLFDVELLVRGKLGVFGLLDAGRVWVDGESPGGWHTGAGGGLSFRSLGRVVRVSVAGGEGARLYFDFGLP